MATDEASPATAVVVIVGLNREDVSGQSTDQTMWCYVMVLCVLDRAVMQWCPVAHRPSIRAFQAASSDRPCDNYRPPVSSVWACWARHVRRFHARYRPISGHRDNCKVADSTISIAISRNRYEPKHLWGMVWKWMRPTTFSSDRWHSLWDSGTLQRCWLTY